MVFCFVSPLLFSIFFHISFPTRGIFFSLSFCCNKILIFASSTRVVSCRCLKIREYLLVRITLVCMFVLRRTKVLKLNIPNWNQKPAVCYQIVDTLIYIYIVVGRLVVSWNVVIVCNILLCLALFLWPHPLCLSCKLSYPLMFSAFRRFWDLFLQKTAYSFSTSLCHNLQILWRCLHAMSGSCCVGLSGYFGFCLIFYFWVPDH